MSLLADSAANDVGPRRLFDVQPWAEEALCSQVDAGMFFPEKGGSTREAKTICRSCDVRAECLQWALDRGETHGIWGGLSERERRRLTRHKEASCTTQEPRQGRAMSEQLDLIGDKAQSILTNVTSSDRDRAAALAYCLRHNAADCAEMLGLLP